MLAFITVYEVFDLNFLTIFYFIVLLLIFMYYMMSLRFHKFTAAYIAGLSHLILGFLALPSIGWFVIGLGVIELIIAFLYGRRRFKK